MATVALLLIALVMIAGAGSCYGDGSYDSSDSNHSSSQRKVWNATVQGRRQYQEDRVMINEALGLYGIFDGHGGGEASTYALKKFPGLYKRHLSNGRSQSDALKLSILDIEEGFMKVAVKKNLRAGTTAVVANVAESGKVTVAFVGDSVALLCDSDQEPVMLTRDHHPDVPDERERVESTEEGFVYYDGYTHRVNGILAMSRAIGDKDLKSSGVIATPEVYELESNSKAGRKLLVVASDGIFETLSHAMVCKIVGKSGRDAAAELVKIAYETGSRDNLSAIVVELQTEAAAPHGEL